MDQEHTAFINHPAKKASDPYTTEALHPDGAFFAVLCLFSWIIFFWLWAWNHKPKRRLVPSSTANARVVRSGEYAAAVAAEPRTTGVPLAGKSTSEPAAGAPVTPSGAGVALGVGLAAGGVPAPDCGSSPTVLTTEPSVPVVFISPATTTGCEIGLMKSRISSICFTRWATKHSVKREVTYGCGKSRRWVNTTSPCQTTWPSPKARSTTF